MNTKILVNAEGKVAPQLTKTIQPSHGWVPLRLGALWAHRELLYFLVWRDIKVRYKQTIFGVLWAVLQPLMLMLVFSIFLGHLAKVSSDGLPYPVFALCGLVPWQLFAHALTQASNSLVANDRLITKVYFPRLVIPLSAVLSGLLEFLIAFIILLILMFHYEISPTGASFTLPSFVVLAIVSALAVSLWLSALNVAYRDVKYTIPFITQLWLFVSPVAYPSSIVPEDWRWLYALNPMAGVIDGFRWALLGKADRPGSELVISVAVVITMLVGGLYYFRRMEKTFADVV